MTVLLMNLRNVPEDEAEEVRALLQRHGIAFYETRPSKWGLSGGGIWLREDHQAAHARELLAAYQRGRFEQARAEYEARRRDGHRETLLTRLFQEPLRVLLYLGVIGFVLYLAMTPLLFLWR